MVFARVRFGVLRLGTSPKTSFINDNLIKQFATRRLAIAQNVPCLPPPEKKEIKNKGYANVSDCNTNVCVP